MAEKNNAAKGVKIVGALLMVVAPVSCATTIHTLDDAAMALGMLLFFAGLAAFVVGRFME
jgi:hypothetical protein